MTSKFLAENNLKMIIRSHELKGESGYFAMVDFQVENQVEIIHSSVYFVETCGGNNDIFKFLFSS